MAMNGAVRLVKIDVDKNPAYAGQLKVQSIPTVYAFVNGQPVDGFMGAQAESEIKRFVDKLAGPPPVSEIDEELAQAKESFDLGDMGGAAQGYATVLRMDPANLPAIGGLARCYIAGGDYEHAAEVVALAPEGARDADLDAARAALTLADGAGAETAPFEKALAANPDDHQARFDLAGALAGLGLGLAVSLVLVHVVNPQSFHWTMDLLIPWGRLLLLCGAVVMAGTLTAWLAGRAAAGRDAVLAVKEDW